MMRPNIGAVASRTAAPAYDTNAGVFSTSVQLTLHPGAPSPYGTRRSESIAQGLGLCSVVESEVGAQFRPGFLHTGQGF